VKELLIVFAVAAVAIAFRFAVSKGITNWLDRHGKK
jgi:hypothetical protein